MTARLLVVDDEAAHMRALCETLELDGYRPTGFTSASQALQSIGAGEYELILTDLMMPELDGIGLVTAARQIDPELAGVIMTGHGTIDTAVAALQAGALDYVLKPIKLNVIRGVIRRALESRTLRIENALLLRRDKEQAAELANAYEDLEAFSYSVSHDLRAPLRASRGYLDMFLTDFGADLSIEGRRQLQLAADGGARMDRLIEDLLKFCRLSRVPVIRQSIDMSSMASRVANELQACESGRNVNVRIGNLPSCQGDPSLLEQVLVNLISNAIKFTRDQPSASVEVDYTAATGQTGSASRCVYHVRDNGAGFDMKYIDKLFGVFQRLHSAEQFSGTGVGLSIVKRIIQRHGGAVWAESMPRSGATFYFTIGESDGS